MIRMQNHSVKTITRPRHIQGLTRNLRLAVAPPKAAPPVVDLVQSSYFIGQGIILFTMFYCTTNWWYYRRVREDIEKKQKPKK